MGRAARTDADVDQPEFELEPDLEVSAQRCRVEATQALSLAREHGDAGRYEDARSVWEEGGRAELHDMCQMNMMQRSSTLNQKSKCAVRRTSMNIYTNSVQKSWIAKSSNA